MRMHVLYPTAVQLVHAILKCTTLVACNDIKYLRQQLVSTIYLYLSIVISTLRYKFIIRPNVTNDTTRSFDFPFSDSREIPLS